MRVVAAAPPPSVAPESEHETVILTEGQLQFLGALCHRLNPDMPIEFGGAHVVRTLLERLEEAGFDLAEANSEEEIAPLTAEGLRKLRRAP